MPVAHANHELITITLSSPPDSSSTKDNDVTQLSLKFRDAQVEVGALEEKIKDLGARIESKTAYVSGVL